MEAKKTFNLGKIKTAQYANGGIKGLVLNRDVTVREARHIMTNIFGIVINTLEDCDDAEEYKYWNQELVKDVNDWLRGNVDDDTMMDRDYIIMDYAGDCSDEALGVMCMIPLLEHLKKKKIID